MNYRFVSGKKKRELIMFKIYFENSYDFFELKIPMTTWSETNLI